MSKRQVKGLDGFRSGFGKLWPVGHLFLWGPQTKNGLYIFKWLKNSQKKNAILWPMKFKFWCPLIKFYWNIATHTHTHTYHLLLLSRCKGRLNSCDGDSLATALKIFTSWPFRRSLLTPDLERFFREESLKKMIFMLRFKWWEWWT